ncbi:hypothetical protein CR513_29348, partial [Mucuna pruriens]
MHQGSKSVEEYFKDMEVALIRANMLEPNEATFLDDLMMKVKKGLERLRVQRIGIPYHEAQRKTPNLGSSSKRSNIKCFKCLGK